MKKILTIAGSDCSGGAGIQADIKTIAAHGHYAMSVVTALTAQNTTGVFAIQEIPPAFIAAQMDAVFEDIRPDAVKIGMVSSDAVIQTIAERLRYYGAKNIVVDPVMVSTSGSRLLSEAAKEALVAQLFPLARVVTPNIPESEVLCGFSVRNREEMVRAARTISRGSSCAALVKGGHAVHDASDLLCESGRETWLEGERVDNPNTHGTGCTLSSTIASNLASGFDLGESVRRAKAYLTAALKAMLDLGRGAGPLDHMFMIGNPDKGSADQTAGD